MLESESEIETVSIGEQLKECRDSKHISINEIADQLHLDTWVIRAIEEDDYDTLPDPIYVRGYILNYCRLLDLDANEFLELFRKNVAREDPEIFPEINYPSQTSSSDKPVKVFTYLISLGFVLLVITWWQSNFIINNQTDIEPIQTEDTSLLDVETTDNLIEGLTIDEVNDFSSSTFDLPGDIVIETVNDMDISPAYDNEYVDPGTASVDDAEAEIATVLDNEITEEIQATQSISSSEETDQAEPLPSFGPDTLLLNITEDSWIEIFDVNRQQIYFNLGRSGDQLILKGTAPFDILLGYAQGVKIEFNNNPVDQTPYTRAGVARFTLGE